MKTPRLLSIIFGLSAAVTAFASGDGTCAFSGRGEAYDPQGVRRPEADFAAHAVRTQVSGGLYQMQEHRTFTDGHKTSFSYGYSTNVGLFNYSTDELQYVGQCLYSGYCVGHARGAALNADFTTNLESAQISTTYRQGDTVILEVLAADPGCFLAR
jgi:hypothetical protein